MNRCPKVRFLEQVKKGSVIFVFCVPFHTYYCSFLKFLFNASMVWLILFSFIYLKGSCELAFEYIAHLSFMRSCRHLYKVIYSIWTNMSKLIKKCLSFSISNRRTIKPRQPINNRPVTFMWMILSEMNTDQDIDKSVKITLLWYVCRCGSAVTAKKVYKILTHFQWEHRYSELNLIVHT